MELDSTPLIEAAVGRSGVPLEELTDAKQIGAVDWAGKFPTLSATDLADVSRVPDGATYETLNGSLSSVLAYAVGNWENGLAAVVEDCESYDNMKKFMHAALDLLIERPNMFEGVTLDLAKLTEIRQAI